ncbi:membrane protein [Streptosporangium oxazolinicum]|uniref:Membrane protein n=1 Tax=Streptosporangium oxazolinicum TaxID=909287 RepID=A0ABP8B0F1_9ACTN
MSTVTASPAAVATSLRRLYFVRFGFALVWAGLLIATASPLGPIGVTLLVLYPLFDGVAAVVDARSSKATGPALSLYVNVAISWITAVGLAFAASSGIPAVLRVWGAWAIVSGLIQLAVGVIRRDLNGHWPMIISGAISVVAGTSFVLQAAQEGASLVGIAGYATLGGLFFLASALRLGRVTQGL